MPMWRRRRESASDSKERNREQMEKQKPYLTFSHPRPGPSSFLMKKAAEKNAQIMRGRTVKEHREAMQLLADVRLISPVTRFEAAQCAGVPCEWAFQADSPADRVILYIHGGSWIYGNRKTARPVGMLLSEVTGCRVLVMEYRLAPEHPYPAATEDCSMVYRWLGENGYPAEHIALFGDSAGGNLALSLLHRLKAQGRPLPCAVGLASPVTDLTENSELSRGMPDLVYTQHEGREQDIFSLYTNGHDRSNPLLSPVFGNLAGFPPLLIHVGQDEELCADCDRFAGKAFKMGVDVSLKVWRDMYHDFTIVGRTLKESRQSLKEFGAFFKQHLLLP